MTIVPIESRQAATGAPLLRVHEAHKTFGDVRALRSASFELRAGELLALLGPNGAGKTTLLRAVGGRVTLDRGTVELFGAAASDAARRKRLGIVPQEIALYPLLTARENLEAFGSLHGVARQRLSERVAWALKWTGLKDRSREPIKNFSGGMKRRLNIACSVLHEPGIVLLDEPTVGVDPQSRERIYEMLDGLRAGGASLLLTTHQLEEAEARCDRVVIIDHGQVVAEGTTAELVERTVGTRRTVIVALVQALTDPVEGFAVDAAGLRLTAEVADVGAELPGLLSRVHRGGYVIEDVEVRRHGLHAVFLHLTGKELRE
jgi:ABC-2 type transport system ATP-binding protein